MADEKKIEVNVEEIMTEIRRKIQMETEVSQLPSFESVPIDGEVLQPPVSDDGIDWQLLSASLEYINRNYEIPYYWSFGASSVKTFVKRVVRKLARCIMLPILAQQNHINANVAKCISQLRNALATFQSQITSRDKRLDELNNLVKEQAITLKSYEENTKQLESMLNDMQKNIAHLQAYSISQEKEPDNLFFSQSGEDMILSYLCKVLGIDESCCSYLDLGANHAKALSNTYYFYRKGARGVLVEANPELISELNLYRREDTILNRCVSDCGGRNITFYVMNNDGLSSPYEKQVKETIVKNPGLIIKKELTVETITVNEILERYFSNKAPIFLNIDIEGEELNILRSINFDTHRPMLIAVETIPYYKHLVVGDKNMDIINFMFEKDYIEYAFTGINSIFIDKRQINVIGWDWDSVLKLLSMDGKSVNFMPYVQRNDFTSRTSLGIELSSGGLAYGPYFSMPSGHYTLNVDMVLGDETHEHRLAITSEKGKKVLKEYLLSNGDNSIAFELNEQCDKVEFVIRNETDKSVTIRKMNLS